MRVERKVRVAATPADVWALISDPASLRSFFHGVTRWEVAGEQSTGLGARYDIRFAARAAEVGSLVEVVEYQEERELAWTSVTGLDQRGRWRIRDRGEEGTEITLRLAYQAPGGFLGSVSDRLSGPIVTRHVERTLANLKSIVEGGRAVGQDLTEKGLLDQLRWQLKLGTTFARAGIVSPVRPDKLPAMLKAFRKWGRTPAAGYVIGAIRHPDDEAVIDELGTVSWGEMDARSNALANALMDAGVKAGDGVAVLCRNHRYWFDATIACSKVGAHALYLNTAFSGPQLTEVVKREDPKALVYDQEFTDMLAEAGEGRERFVAWVEDEDGVPEPTIDEIAATGDRTEPAEPAVIGKQIILTSGTTGTPKGASRRPLSSLGPAVAFLSRIPLKAGERWHIVAPLFHSWGYAHFQIGLLLNATFIVRRRFDPEETLRVIDEYKARSAPMVPVMAQRILDLPEEVRSRYDTSSLRAIPLSGSALPGELALRIMDEFGDVAYNLYGSTEVAYATIATPEDLRAAPGTAGKAPAGTFVRIYDEQGREAPPGETGRIFVANEMLFEGYTGGGSKDEIDGLMATGDVGHLDEAGRLFVSGRDDEMIVSGGENVFPREVEDLLSKHEGIAEVAIIGVEDAEFGQRLKAFAVRREGAEVTEDELKKYVKENLARYKVPREIEFMDELPRNATGKVLKRVLEERESEGSKAG